MSKVKYIPAQEAREESPARWELDGYAIERDGDEVCSIGKKTGRGDWISMDAARAYHAILGAILGDQPAASDDKGCEVCACRDEDCANPKHAHHPTHQPAASETPADPRRTVGAVVYDTADDGHRIPGDLIVVADGGGQKYLDDVGRKGFAGPDESDRFSRWATRAECERHGIPYVERDAKPASPAASETPAAKFKVGDRVRVKRLSFHEGVGVDWPTRTKGYKVGNEFDVAWASPDGDKVDRMDGSGQYLFADELELVHPAAPARSERPTTTAPRDEAKDEARRTPAFLPPGDDVDAAIAYAKTVHPVSDARFYAARDAFLEGTRWRARDGGR